MRIERAGHRSAIGLLAAVVAFGAGLTGAMANGVPEPWQMGMQDMVTDLGRFASSFHTYLVWLITAISILVAALLVWCIIRFNEKANPVPSRTSHHTLLEVAWTVVPVMILVAIAIPSFRLMREQLTIPPADIIVKATGHAWYWNYAYPQEQANFQFDSNLAEKDTLKPDQPYLLAVDNEVVVPVNKVVQLNVTAADVLHAFAMPAFGIKIDAVPGRLNQVWFKADREGVYYGQCSELCGARHAYMPIAIRVVNDADYAAWLAEAKQKYARIDGTADTKLAAR